MKHSNEVSEFGNWKINLSHYSLMNKQGDEIFVEPRLLKLLNFLNTNANKVVKRDELIDHVWGDVVVTEESLSKAVFDLRKFLNEKFKDAPRIVTIRKVGYKMEPTVKAIPTQHYHFLRLAAKVLIYFCVAVLAFVIIVRAIRYEN